MKITLDHNCIIDLVNQTDLGEKINSILAKSANECFVVNIGASEMHKHGVRPDHYDKFESLLEKAGIAHLNRLDPMMIWDVTFWDKCVWSNNEMSKLAEDLNKILFCKSKNIEITKVGLDSLEGKKWRNRLCDVHSLWCHIHYKNDVFLTTDGNFTKETKLPKLISLGAGSICHPEFLDV